MSWGNIDTHCKTIRDRIPSHPVVNEILTYLSKKRSKVYLFGSSVWKIINGDEKITDYDIAIKSEKENESQTISQIINNLREKFPSFTFTTEKVQTLADLYDIISVHRHYLLKTINEQGESLPNCDLILCEEINRFAGDLCDVDNGMLLYDYYSDQLVIGGNRRIFDIQYILDICQNKKLGFEYIHEQMKKTDDNSFYSSYSSEKTEKQRAPRTTFYRIIKKIREGFTYNIDELYELLCTVFVRSFCIGNDEDDLPKHKQLFVKECLKEDAYKIFKECFVYYLGKISTKVNTIRISDHYSYVISYALLMKDFDFAIELSKTLKERSVTGHDFDIIAEALVKSYGSEFDKIEIFISILEDEFHNVLKERSKYKNVFTYFSERSLKTKQYGLYDWLCKRNEVYSLKHDDYAEIIMKSVQTLEDFQKLLLDERLLRSDFDEYISSLIHVGNSLSDMSVESLIIYMIDKPTLWDMIDQTVYENKEKCMRIKVRNILNRINYLEIVEAMYFYGSGKDKKYFIDSENGRKFCKRYSCEKKITKNIDIYSLLWNMSDENEYFTWILFSEVCDVDRFIRCADDHNKDKCTYCRYKYISMQKQKTRLDQLQSTSLTRTKCYAHHKTQVISDIFVMHLVKLNVNLESFSKSLAKQYEESQDLNVMNCLKASFKNYDISPDLEMSRKGISMVDEIIRNQ